jgi:hypothetical protein
MEASTTLSINSSAVFDADLTALPEYDHCISVLVGLVIGGESILSPDDNSILAANFKNSTDIVVGSEVYFLINSQA